MILPTVGEPRIVGVVVELLVALGVIGAGAGVLAGRLRGRGWSLVWGAVPSRRDAGALVALGVGLAVWAVSQAQDRAMGQAVVGLVVVGVAGAFLAATQLARPPEDG